MLSVEQIKARLKLEPLPLEGGYFAETYRSEECIAPAGLPPRYAGRRALGTAIYYLLTPDTFSALHRLPTDEVYHFYLGDPVHMLQLQPDGSGQVITLGSQLADGMQLQVVVPRGAWQGSRLAPGGSWALMGTTMAPGFEPADFEAGDRPALLSAYPLFREWIEALTRQAPATGIPLERLLGENDRGQQPNR